VEAACGKKKTVNINSGRLLTDHDVNKDFQNRSAQKRQNQVGATNSFDQTSSSSGKLEKTTNGTDNSTVNWSSRSIEKIKPKTGLPKRKPLTVTLYRKTGEKHANPKPIAEYSSKYKQMIERKFVANVETEEPDQDAGSEIFNLDDSTTESPWARPIMKHMQWSEFYLGGEQNYSDGSLTLLEPSEMKVDERATENSGQENISKGNLHEIDGISNLSSFSVRSQDLLTTNVQKHPQFKEKPRGRPMHRSGIGSRKSKERQNSDAVTSLGTRGKSFPGTRRKSIPVSGPDFDNRSTNKSDVMRNENVNAIPEISDSETIELVSEPSNTDRIDLP